MKKKKPKVLYFLLRNKVTLKCQVKILLVSVIILCNSLNQMEEIMFPVYTSQSTRDS